MQWCVIQKVSKNNCLCNIVASVINAEDKQKAIEMAKKGWIWTDDEDYEIEVEVQRLFHEPVQIIDHISFVV